MRRQQQRLEDVLQVTQRLAHDFGNVLTSILGYCELTLCQISSTSPAHKFAHEVFRSAQRGAELVSRLRSMGQVSEACSTPTSLTAALQQEQARIQQLRGSSVRLDWDVEDGLAFLPIQPAQLEQLLQCLLDNSQEAIADQGTVTVTVRSAKLTEADASEVLGAPEPRTCTNVRVTDTGHGWSAAALERLFEVPFFSDKAGHRGYGLTIAYAIVQANRGGIRIGGKPGEGAQVDVYLPHPADKPGMQVEHRQRNSESDDTNADDRPRTVLVVDDEQNDGALLKHSSVPAAQVS